MTNQELCAWLRENSSGVYRPAAEAAARIEELSAQVDAFLQHCPDPECGVCGSIICPQKDGMHFHHDGCPSCAESDAATPAEPAPASTGREAQLLQALRDADKVSRTRGDKYGLCDAIDNHGQPYQSQWLADLLATSVAPRELDVEAEHVRSWQERCDWQSSEPAKKLMVEAMKAEIAELRTVLAARFRAEGGSTKQKGAGQIDSKHAETRMDAGSEVVIEAAPVSTEQAGDARDAARYRHIKADNHRCADNTFCLFLDLDGNLLPVASADMDAEIDAAMLEAAPSPNNSPAGRKSD